MDKEAKEGTEGGLLESSLSHWLPPPVAPSGFQGISGAAVAVVGLHLEMATNGESRAPVLATSPPLFGSVISSQSQALSTPKSGKRQAGESSESCVCWGQSVLLSLNHRRNHQLCRTPPAVAHHWGPDLGRARPWAKRRVLFVVCRWTGQLARVPGHSARNRKLIALFFCLCLCLCAWNPRHQPSAVQSLALFTDNYRNINVGTKADQCRRGRPGPAG